MHTALFECAYLFFCWYMIFIILYACNKAALIMKHAAEMDKKKMV